MVKMKQEYANITQEPNDVKIISNGVPEPEINQDLETILKTGGHVPPKEHESKSSKWKNAFSVLIPWKRTSKDDNEIPLEKAGCWNYFTVGWVTSVMIKAIKSGLGYKDLYTLSTRDQSKESASRLQRIWMEEIENAKKSNREPSFGRACRIFCQTRVIISSVFFIGAVILQFIAPSIVLKMILDFINDAEREESEGWYLLLGLGIMLLLRLSLFTLNFNVGLQTAIRLSGATQYLGYSKLLRLANPTDKNLGQLITCCTSDQERIVETVVITVLLFGTPIMFILSTIYSWLLVGPMSLLGLLIVLLLYPIMVGVATLTSYFRRKVVLHTDKRVSLMNEVINSIRLIKMYAWEIPFTEKIQKIRLQEMKELQKTAFLQSVSFSITPCITVVAAVITVIALTETDYELTAPVAFTLFSIFTALQFTVATLPIAMKSIAESRVCLDRFKKFLLLPEYEKKFEDEQRISDSEMFSIVFEDFNAAREIESKDDANDVEDKEKEKLDKTNTEETEALKTSDDNFQVLFNLNLKVEPGQLIGIAGAVGSGKSSVISAIAGELKHLSGEYQILGRLAFVPQQAWIYSGSVRENILFGSNYNENLFTQVIEATSLRQDLENWPQKDLTEVGDRGLMLSGGQKQRISLARAVYAVLDDQNYVKTPFIILLDDPLSAVDTAVAKHIYENTILKLLKGHTIILATHGMQYLNRCDHVVFMKNGTISEFGSYEDLMKSGKDLYSMVSYDQSQKMDQDTTSKEDNKKGFTKKDLRKRTVSITSNGDDDGGNGETLNNRLEEEQDQLNAGWIVLLKYYKACGGYFVMFCIFMIVLAFALIRLFTSIWLQIWLDDGDGSHHAGLNGSSVANNENSTIPKLHGNISDNPQRWFYQLVHGLSLIVLVLVGVCKGYGMAITLLKGASNLHEEMLCSVMKSPMAFFDSTPAGRVINRFSKDMDEMDVRMPYYTEFVVQAMFLCLSQLFVVCLVYPLFIVVVLVLLVIFALCDIWMNKGVIETRKLENKTKGPVITDITSVLPGIPVIRGFERQSVFQKKFDADLNRNLSAQMLFRFSNRWYALRMDLLGTLTILITAGVCIFSRNSVTPAEAGLALVNIFQMATFLPYVMRMKADYRARFNSVERVCEYAYDLEKENTQDAISPPNDWPSSGKIEFKELCYKYKPDMPLVLKNVNLEIDAGTKIGVVGRTGAGKTTLFSAILRLTELESGQILIDDIDISKVELKNLRSNIAVIPQDPVLFEGTIRYNLDPFEQYDDDVVWSVIKKAHLHEKISENEDGLNMKIANEGDNLSVGEKQLLCLARALLRQNKILLLDEATASVDVETDYKIQDTIKEAFADCTVITIAHRIHTILNYDKIIVMKKGEIIEYGEPKELMENVNGLFKFLVESAQLQHNIS